MHQTMQSPQSKLLHFTRVKHICVVAGGLPSFGSAFRVSSQPSVAAAELQRHDSRLSDSGKCCFVCKHLSFVSHARLRYRQMRIVQEEYRYANYLKTTDSCKAMARI
jgi:hypothetical protein